MLILKASLATTEVSAGAVAKADQKLVTETLGVQLSPEIEAEIFMKLTANKISPQESSGVGVQEKKKLNDRGVGGVKGVGGIFLLHITSI